MTTLSAKPGLRHSVSDWEARNRQLSETAEHQRHVSRDVRQEGLVLRNETSTKVRGAVRPHIANTLHLLVVDLVNKEKMLFFYSRPI